MCVSGVIRIVSWWTGGDQSFWPLLSPLLGDGRGSNCDTSEVSGNEEAGRFRSCPSNFCSNNCEYESWPMLFKLELLGGARW